MSKLYQQLQPTFQAIHEELDEQNGRLDQLSSAMPQEARTAIYRLFKSLTYTADDVAADIETLRNWATVVYASWDFRESLVDSVGGLTAVLGYHATRDGNGILLSHTNDFVLLDGENCLFTPGRKVDFVVGTSAATFTNEHGRLFMFPSTEEQVTDGRANNGLVYRNSAGGYWCTYVNAWGDATALTNKDAFSDKTVTLHKIATETGAYVDIYIDGEFITRTPESTWLVEYPSISIGSYSGQAFRNITIKSCRIYEEAS